LYLIISIHLNNAIIMIPKTKTKDQDFPKKSKKPKYNDKYDPLRKNKKAYLMNPLRDN
jgi:hypothetical protein